jgi:hypothetical protein
MSCSLVLELYYTNSQLATIVQSDCGASNGCTVAMKRSSKSKRRKIVEVNWNWGEDAVLSTGTQ